MKSTLIGIIASSAVFSGLMQSAIADTRHDQQLAELRNIKQRIIDELTFNALPDGSPERNRHLADLDRQTEALLAAEGGYWSRFPDANVPQISHHGGAFSEVFSLACAFSTRGSAHHASPTVRQAIEKGLRHFLRFVHAECPKPHNWWAWEIGIPMHLMPTLLLVEDVIEPELLQAELDTLTYLLNVAGDAIKTGPAAAPTEPDRGKTDMNALWRARLRLQYAVLLKNPAMAAKWSRLAFGEMAPPGEGSWQADFSYKFHGQNPMWTYGNVFIHDYAMIVDRYHGTSFGPTDEQIRLFGVMAEHYYEGFLYNGRICPAIVGRTLSRRSNPHFDVHGPLALTALAALAQTDHPRAERYAAIVRRDALIYRDPDIHQPRVDVAIQRTPRGTPAPPTDDIFAYPDSDFMQITRPGWAVGIKLHSRRNAGYESINRENLQGWFLSHGSTFHYIDGTEWNCCWPTLDWTRLPGTTVALANKAGNASPFAGVIRGSRRCGLAAAHLQSGTFTARTSWLVAGDHIICLGSSISSPGRVETTVFNQPVSAGAALVTDGGSVPDDTFRQSTKVQWCWLEDMGYVFLRGSELTFLRETRTSDYSSIRGPELHGAGETLTHEYLTGVIVHADQPSSYAYVIVPNVPLAAMPARADHIARHYTIKTDNAHHVSAVDGSTESVVFWENGQSGDVACDQPCMFLREAKHWQLIDPIWTDAQMDVRIGERGYHPTPSKGRPVTIDHAPRPS